MESKNTTDLQLRFILLLNVLLLVAGWATKSLTSIPHTKQRPPPSRLITSSPAWTATNRTEAFPSG